VPVDYDDLESVKAEARRLHKNARLWLVEIDEAWYCTDAYDHELFIGGLYHDRVRARIRRMQIGVAVGVVSLAIAIAALR
jgi:hypothetical protein